MLQIQDEVEEVAGLLVDLGAVGAEDPVPLAVEGPDADDQVVVFTRNTPDSLNLLATAVPGDVVLLDIEHHANLLPWKNSRIVEAADTVDTSVNAADAEEANKTGMLDDFGDEAGEHALSATDEDDDRCDKMIDLKDMVEGYSATPPPGCAE